MDPNPPPPLKATSYRRNDFMAAMASCLFRMA